MTPKEAIKILQSQLHLDCTADLAIKELRARIVAIEAIEKQAEYRNRIKDLITIIENICKNSRDRHSDDEHCGLCEYDGAYIGESGDWCNECPGFDKDDCFELSNRFISRYIDWSEEE